MNYNKEIEKNATYGYAETMHTYEIASTIEKLSSKRIKLGFIKAYGRSTELFMNICPSFLSTGKISIDIYLECDADEYGYEPWAKLSCRHQESDQEKLKDYEFYVKEWSENADWIDQMLQFPQFEDTGRELIGHGCPIWRINPDKC